MKQSQSLVVINLPQLHIQIAALIIILMLHLFRYRWWIQLNNIQQVYTSGQTPQFGLAVTVQNYFNSSNPYDVLPSSIALSVSANGLNEFSTIYETGFLI